MRPFRFTLHALLTLRQRQERLALEQYGQALRVRATAVAAVTQAAAEMTAAWLALRAELERSCSAARAAFHRAQCAALEERSRRAQAEARAAERAVRMALTRFNEARRQREAVDHLRDRRRTLFDREAARQEGRVLDDLAGRRWRPLLSAPPRHPL